MFATRRPPQSKSPAHGAARRSTPKPQGKRPAASTVARRNLLERARHVLEAEIEYIHHESFDDNVRAEYLADYVAPENERTPPLKKAGGGLPAYLASLYETPLLSRGHESHLFRKMNYLKHSAEQLRQQIDLRTVKAADLDEIDCYLQAAANVRDELIRANLRLVVSIAKQFVDPQHSFDDLVSEGNVALMRSVEKFDYSRGNRFSTYATWAIKRNLFHAMNGERRQHARFLRGDQEALDASAEVTEKNRPVPPLSTLQALEQIFEELNEREQEVLKLRFGLHGAERGHTLREIGGQLGVSKERIRQIELRAVARLRELAEEAHLESPEV